MEQWKNNWKDYYAVLGVRMNTEPEVIRGAYNAMARKYHPDVNAAGAARMKDVNEAYEVLSDSLKKADYDAAYRECRQDGGSRKETEQEQDGEGMGEGGGAWQAASSAWRHFRQSRAGRPSCVDAGEKIIPWPSRSWQQAALLFSIPLGLGLAILSPLVWFQLGGGALFLAGGYACLETRCISQVEEASVAARFLGTVVVLVMLIVIGAILLALALGLVTAAIAALLIGLLVVKAVKR